jgi:hypothetical protein
MITTEYHLPIEDDNKKPMRDSAFFVGDYGHELVATVSDETRDRSISVFCDGEMRIHLWETKEARDRGDDPEVIRYVDRLLQAGLTNDELLAKANEEERLEWINNTWFDLYASPANDAEGGWLNAVHHDIVEAVEQAKELINDEELWEELANYEDK